MLEKGKEKACNTRLQAISDWRRRRDLNSRAGYPTYTLSRGASSANLSTSPNFIYFIGGGEGEIRTHGALASLVFKTSSINRSDTSPNFNYYSIANFSLFVKRFLKFVYKTSRCKKFEFYNKKPNEKYSEKSTGR